MKSKISITTNPANQPRYNGPLDFAFIVHPRDTDDILRAYPHLCGLPETEIAAYVRNFSTLVLGSISVSLGGRNLHGELLSVPYLASDFRREIRRVQESLFDVLDYSVMRDTRIIGLGALLPSITHHGRAPAERAPVGVGITTGHSYTAHAIAEYIRKIETLRGSPQTVAIVGAAGSTGRATIDCLLSDGIRRPLILVDVASRIACLEEIPTNAAMTCTSNLWSLLEAEVVVCVTNATHSILRSEHLAPHCIVIDDAQPPNISLDVVRSRPDVIVLKCLARVPNLECPFDFGLFNPEVRSVKQDIVFTCLAETVMLAASGHSGHFTIGHPTREQVEYISGLAAKLSVGIAAFQSFPEIGEIDDGCIQNISHSEKETPPCGGVLF